MATRASGGRPRAARGKEQARSSRRPSGIETMTSQGTAHGRFTRAIKSGHLLDAEMAARELGSLSLSDSLALVLLYQRSGDEKFERAARRWVRRMQVHCSLRHRE